MDTNRIPETPDRDENPAGDETPRDQTPRDQNPRDQTPARDDRAAAHGAERPAGEPAAQSTVPPAVPPSSATYAAAPAPAPAPAAFVAAPAAPAQKPAVWRRKPVWITAAVVGLLAVGGAGAAYALDERDDDDRSWSTSDDRRGGDYRDAGDDRDGSGDRDRDDRDDRDRGDRDRDDRDQSSQDLGTAGQGGAPTDGDRPGDSNRDADDRRDADDVPLTDAEVAAVTDAALAEAGGGTVTDVDRSDDRDHAFEVDVLLENGDELEVELDEGYVVVWTELDPADRD